MKTTSTLFVLFSALFAQAQYGTPDPTFGENGKTHYITQSNEQVAGMVLQSTGKSVVLSNTGDGSSYATTLVRFNSDGSVDPSFGIAGSITLSLSNNMFPLCNSISVLPNDQLLVGFTANGSDGSINEGCFRLVENGLPDLNFGTDGYFIYNAASGFIYGGITGSSIQPDGKAILFGTSFYLTNGHVLLKRINDNGTPDPDFGNNSVVDFDNSIRTDVPMSVKFTDDDKILVAGYAIIPSGSELDPAYDDIALERFNMDGTADLTFSEDGKFTTNLEDFGDGLKDVVLLPDGSFYAGGYIADNTPDTYTDGFLDFLLCKFTEAGELDPQFGNNGYLKYDLGSSNDLFSKMEMDADGHIVMAGTRALYGTNDDFVLLRVNQDGTVDETFGNNGIVIADLYSSLDDMIAVHIQEDGKILTAGYTNVNGQLHIGLARFLGDTFAGVEETDENEFEVFPNPAEDKIQMKIHNSGNISTIAIINALGQCISTISNSIPNQISVQSLQPGVYHLLFYDQLHHIKAAKSFIKE